MINRRCGRLRCLRHYRVSEGSPVTEGPTGAPLRGIQGRWGSRARLGGHERPRLPLIVQEFLPIPLRIVRRRFRLLDLDLVLDLLRTGGASPKKQRRSYSGKKKRHTQKAQSVTRRRHRASHAEGTERHTQKAQSVTRRRHRASHAEGTASRRHQN